MVYMKLSCDCSPELAMILYCLCLCRQLYIYDVLSVYVCVCVFDRAGSICMLVLPLVDLPKHLVGVPCASCALTAIAVKKLYC